MRSTVTWLRDYENAFYRFQQDQLFEFLVKIEIDDTGLRLLQTLYRKQRESVLVGADETDKIAETNALIIFHEHFKDWTRGSMQDMALWNRLLWNLSQGLDILRFKWRVIS